MNLCYVIFIILVIFTNSFCDEIKSKDLVKSSGTKLSRHKRYVVFPEGSSVSVAVCMTIGVIGNPNSSFLSWAVNWGIAYELPNETLSHREKREIEMPKMIYQRRHRKELYNKMEIAMDSMGYNGKECIYRALCESSQKFSKKGKNMIEELLRSIFSLPKPKVLTFEPKELLQYDVAHRKGLSKSYCPSLYPRCEFSLLEIVMGQHSRSGLNFMNLAKSFM